MIHKHTGRWMWQESASVVSWNREKCARRSRLVQPCQCCCCLCYPGEYLRIGTLINYNWAQVLEACDCLKLLSIYIDLCVDDTGVVCSAWSSRHWSPCRRLWRLCRDTQLILLVLLPLLTIDVISKSVSAVPLLLNHRCHQQIRDWWLFCLQCGQRLRDLLRHLSWSFPEKCWRE